MSEPKRVLQVVPNMQQGGLENYVMNLYRNTDRDLVQFDFLEHYSTDHFFDEEIRDLGGRIYRIPLMEDKKRIPSYIKQLDRLYATHHYNVVHGHMATTAGLYLHAAKKHGVQNRILHAHEDSYIKNVRGYVRKFLIQHSSHDATQLFACSKSSGEYYYGSKNFSVLHNAIDTERFSFSRKQRNRIRGRYGLTDDNFVLCHVGRFSLQKNHDRLIDIFAEIYNHDPRAFMFLIGVGETQEHIKQKVHDLGLDASIAFIGNTSTPEQFYSASDVFVLPSVFEGLPLTGVEAQTNGLPCVFSDVITREVDLTGGNQYISLQSDDEVWTRKILHLRDNSRSIDRLRGIQDVRNAGYDVRSNASFLQKLYLSELG